MMFLWRRSLEQQWGGQNRRFGNNFGRHIFRTFIAEANIIMRRHEVPYRLSCDL